MMKLFRNIRQNLLNQGKTIKPALPAGRYFKYAIGEIVLVVIGILTAENLAPVHSSRRASVSFSHSFGRSSMTWDARKGGFSKDMIYNVRGDIPLGIKGERKGKTINQ
jgi:hypothetical protein